MLPPFDESDIVAALNSTKRKHSQDVLALYQATGGMKSGEMDSNMWSLWPLQRVVSENAKYDRPHILFADFLINSHCYCFKYESNEKSSVCVEYFNGEEPTCVADSVNDFFEIYLRNAEKLEMFD